MRTNDEWDRILSHTESMSIIDVEVKSYQTRDLHTGKEALIEQITQSLLICGSVDTIIDEDDS